MTMVTTLSPCWYCSGLVRQFNIGTVVVGESVNFSGGIDWLREDVDSSTHYVRRERDNTAVFVQAHGELGAHSLQASLRHGVIIPCGCGEGMCGTCMVKLVSGQVAMAANGGITPEEQAQGYILACSSRALSDIAVALA